MNHALDIDLINVSTLLATSREYLGLDNASSSDTAVKSPIAGAMPRFNQRKKNMNNYRRFVRSILLATGLGTFLAGSAFAEAGCSAMTGGPAHYQHHAKMMEQHHKQLHDALKLTPEQEPGWKALMDAEQPRPSTSGAEQPADWAKLSMPERAEKMLALTKARQEHMSEYVAALKGFYATLNTQQQKIFEEMHVGQRGGMHGKHRTRHPGPGTLAPKS